VCQLRKFFDVKVASVTRFSIAVLAMLLSLVTHETSAQVPFFSGAEGFGGTFTGTMPSGGWFSTASIYHVTNLNDSGAGSLRNAFVQGSSNKIIVFDVAGTIQLTSGSLDIKNISNYYIAGQTAPGPVTVYGDTTQITHSNSGAGSVNSNIILRYMTFRRGSTTAGNEDALTFAGGSSDGSGSIGTNMIVDHVSTSWGTDENLSVANNNTNVTVQYAIIADALRSDHAYGSLIRPRSDASVTYQHNLYANNSSRQPRPGSYNGKTLTFDFRNNVVYNWRDRAGYTGGSSEAEQELVNMNYVGNYMIAGLATASNTTGTFLVDKNADLTAYNKGNFVDSDKTVNPGGVPNGVERGSNMIQLNLPVTDQHLTQVGSPIAANAVTTQAALDAYSQIVNYVGNYWWSRESIDARIVNNVLNNTGPPPGVAPTNADPTEENAVINAPQLNRAAGWDTDGDGMPNNWELAHGLNPNLASDFALNFDGDSYINLQEYLDEAGAFPAPTPLTYVGAASGPTARYALITNWKTSDYATTDAIPIVYPGTNWQPARFDQVQINSGTVAVDSVGQHADVVKIAANSGNNATLNITSGWLKVENDVIIAAPGATAALNLTGGTLRTKTLSKGSGGSFSLMGGKLSADTVNFSLVNNGGTLAPGDSIGATQVNSAPTNIGQTHVVGDLALSSGSLQIELASLASFDKIIVDGLTSLGGTLNVSTFGGYAPSNGNSWQIITSGAITGAFSSVTSGYTVQQQGNKLMLFFGNPTLAGDYNGDGNVNAGDYVTWKKALASGGTLLNETASPGVVDQADYDAWRANFGATNSPGSGSTKTTEAIPEPATSMLMLIAGMLAVSRKISRCKAKWYLRESGTFLQ
jgi:hypothetical protein